MFKHYLITRFNLTTPGWETTKRNERILDEAWYKNRFDLFEKYCLPSVAGQLNQNFTWCILLDIITPDRYRERIRISTGHAKNIRLFYIDGMKEMAQTFQEFLKTDITPGTETIISTRLDNDDMIHRDFVQIVQDIVKRHHSSNQRLVIDLPTGWQLNLEHTLYEVRKIRSSFNPFISVAAPVGDNESVLTRTHQQWSAEKNVISFDQQRLWVEIVHSKNKVNAVRTEIPKSYRFPNEEFGIHSILKREGAYRTFRHNTGMSARKFASIARSRLATLFKK